MMKNKSISFLFIISLAIISCSVLFAVRSFNNNNHSFLQDGYVLEYQNELASAEEKSTQYHFRAGTIYQSRYPQRIAFSDTQNRRVITDQNSFLHYADGSFGALQNGVVLSLAALNDDLVNYYNVSPESVMQNNGQSYSLDHMGTPIQFKEFLWKLSQDKYLLAADSLKLHFSEDDVREFREYLEVSYMDENVIQLANNEGVLRTISADCYVELADGVTINFSEKAIKQYNSPKLTLTRMVVDAEENIEVTPLKRDVTKIKLPKITVVDGKDGKEGGSGETGQAGEIGQLGDDGEVGEEGEAGGKGKNGTKGKDGADGETVGGGGEDGEATAGIKLPVFELSDWRVTATSASGSVFIEDEENLLLSDSISVKIIESGTNKVAFGPEAYSSLNFNFLADTLKAGTEYRLVISAGYTVNNREYTRDFISKVFVADNIGLTVEKAYATETELAFRVIKQDSSGVDVAGLQLYDADGAPLSMENINFTENSQIILFGNLTADTKYQVQFTDVKSSDGVEMATYGQREAYSTLKTPPAIGIPNVIVNKKNASFEMQVGAVADVHNGIKRYRYEIFNSSATEGSKPVKTLFSTTKESVAAFLDNLYLRRNENYQAQVVVEFYDNEKTVEYKSGLSKTFRMDGVGFPTVRFETEEVTFEHIRGIIYIDAQSAELVVNANNPLTIMYENSINKAKTYDPITELTPFQETATTYAIPFDVNGLRASDTYVVTLHGHVNLHDGNAAERMLIGSFVFDTLPPNPFQAFFLEDTSDGNCAINVDFQLQSPPSINSELEANTLSHLTFELYKGATTDPRNLQASVPQHDPNPHPYQSELKEAYFNKTVRITEETFGFRPEQLEAPIYTIRVTGASDYTEYKNEITILNDFVTINKTESAPPLPPTTDALDVTKILNGQAERYGAVRNGGLKDDTVIGYLVKAKFDSDLANSFTYTMYSPAAYHQYNSDPDITAGAQKLGDSYVLSAAGGKIPELVLLFGTGENSEANGRFIRYNSAASRGAQHYFTYTAILKLSEGTYQYPEDYEQGVTLRSELQDAPKQRPEIEFYPWDSDANSARWKYRLLDADAALLDNKMLSVKQGNTVKKTAPLNPGTGTFQEVLLEGLSPGAYTVSAVQNLYPKYVNKQENLTFFTRYFEGVAAPNSAIRFRIEPIQERNRLYLILDGVPANELKRIAALKVEVKASGVVGTDTFYLPVESLDFDNTPVVAAQLLFARLERFQGKTITLDCFLCYDTGKSGFGTASTFRAIQLCPGGSIGQYKVPGTVGNILKNDNYASGSLFTTALTGAQLNYTNRITGYSGSMLLAFTEAGARENDSFEFLTLKAIAEHSLLTVDGQQSASYALGTVVPSVTVNGEITVTLNTADINLQIVGGDALDNKKFYIELYETIIGDELINAQYYTGNIVTGQANYLVKLTGLEPKTNYAFRVWGNINGVKTYLYDPKAEQSGVFYRFATLQTVNITNPAILFVAESYDTKYLVLSYNLSQTLGFKIFYDLEILDEGGNTERLWRYEDLLGDTIISENITYEKNMTKNLYCRPGNEVFRFGENYRITISAVASGGLDQRDDPENILGQLSYQFTLEKLLKPVFGITSTALIDNEGKHNLTFRVLPIDSDKVIVDGLYVARFFNSTGEDVTPSEIRTKVYDVNTPENFTLTGLQNQSTYAIKLYGVTDMTNNGGSENISEVATPTDPQYLLKTAYGMTLDDEGICLGDVTCVKSPLNNQRVQLQFNNSVNLTAVETIQYSIYTSNNFIYPTVSTAFVPQVYGAGTASEYYGFELPTNLTEGGTHYIQVQFYKGGNRLREPEVLIYNK